MTQINYQLLVAYLQNKCTPLETVLMEDWLKEDSKHKLILKSVKILKLPITDIHFH